MFFLILILCDELIFGSGLIRKAPVKVVDMFGRVQVVRPNPSILIVGILVSEPFDVVPELCSEPPVNLRVNDLLDFEV